MSTATRRFITGFSFTTVVMVTLNLLPYLRTRGAYNGDGFEIIGFPFTFRRIGGFAGIYEFHSIALLADIVLALAVALLVGYCRARVRQITQANKSPS